MQNIILGSVREIEQVQMDSRILHIYSNNGNLDPFKAGNTIIVNSKIPVGKNKVAKSAYTLLNIDHQRSVFQIAVKQLSDGMCSTYLNHLHVHDSIEFKGPEAGLSISANPGRSKCFFIATDTAITSVIGFLNNYEEEFLPRKTRIFWFVETRNYFLDIMHVQRLMPRKFKDHTVIELIAPISHSMRISQVMSILEPSLKTMSPEVCYCVGDGDILSPLEKNLKKNGVATIIQKVFFHECSSKILKKKKGTLRTGYTTGACSAAAAKGASRMIVRQKLIKEIESTLPNKDKVLFQIHSREILNDHTAVCSVIKDAGDDPDCTDGAELTVKVVLKRDHGIKLKGGKGVATVTKEGLGLCVGGPAINPVPSKNIQEMVLEEIRRSPYKGAEITISVPHGEEMAKKTINARLGLVGGISILGTRGTVKPFSTSAYRASVIQAVNIAKIGACFQVIVTTGWRTEKAAMALFPNTKEEAFIQVGDFIGTSLRAIKKAGIQRAIIVGMIGKLSKMAEGATMTHQAGSRVNMTLLSKLAAEFGCSEELVKEIEKANTARHITEICKKHNFSALPKMICEKVVQSMDSYLKGGLEIHCYMVDYEGSLLAKQI